MNYPINPVSQSTESQILVRARLVYPYVAVPPVSFEEWEDSLHGMAANPSFFAMGFRLILNDSGSLCLNIPMAMFFIIRASIAPKGAVARIILDEGLLAAEKGNLEYINHLLDKYWKVGKIPGLVQARELHRFLCCETAFDDWFHEQKKRQLMKYERDYFRVDDTNAPHAKVLKRDNGQGEIYLGHDAAERMIMATPTPRGELASEYLRNRFLRGLG